MESLYAEAGVKRKRTVASVLTKITFIIVGILFLLMAVVAVVLTNNIRMFFMYVPVIAIVVAGMVILFPRLNVEYEYIFCDGRFDIARIRGKATRKNLLRVEFENVELVAPYQSEDLKNYKDLPKKDFSSGFVSDNVYVMIAVLKDRKTKIFFEPSEKMLDCMRLKSASKILKINNVRLQKSY